MIEEWEGFDWDEGNSEKSRRKHGITMEECESAFLTEPNLVYEDHSHSTQELRFKMLSKTESGKPLFVVFTIRGNRIRVISARKMSRRERAQYEEKTAKKNPEV